MKVSVFQAAPGNPPFLGDVVGEHLVNLVVVAIVESGGHAFHDNGTAVVEYEQLPIVREGQPFDFALA